MRNRDQPKNEVKMRETQGLPEKDEKEGRKRPEREEREKKMAGEGGKGGERVVKRETELKREEKN